MGEIQAIDATGMDRIAASQHYANRTANSVKTMETTAVVGCKTGVILDIRCFMKQPHDCQVGWQPLKRNLDNVTIFTADKGYDWGLFRQKLRADGVKPVVKHREFGYRLARVDLDGIRVLARIDGDVVVGDTALFADVFSGTDASSPIFEPVK